ncbi:uncharacterized protein L969DRAFT_98428 [Mixia osmundae IAM 14324]|uniref:uncharacterized protein n=1 Tax=Mixia osmundae (strain CBS 9802 / IAM 14324 / JCM 22182 / KY 12970) TaxID=764103 RepID=UPI0004A54CB9|nr:uncharacterized protein L969DRAFT_98428 [Mixia osmundae IAM 14324]KEI40614.1 hypothetical protein L969DRAFT_98428 [Mixia osmundae IAM 14324]
MSWITAPYANHNLSNGDHHFPTRPVDKEKVHHIPRQGRDRAECASGTKAEAELSLNIKKACSPEETAPKAKHVRKCIVYTWDYHSSQSIWTGLRVQPILSDEIQTFKALIVVHKVLQEGHACAIKEGQAQTGWLETCARTVGNDGARGYGSLIRAYVTLILHKLKFHKNHREFNGLFEYEEYISLKNIDDPNEGFETISDLMNLQDTIDSFQKLIYAHFRGSTNNECRISALVPQVKESYGIYRFITSMLRAMHRRTDAADALAGLVDRYNAQHRNLRKFYYECANLKYLTGLINVPKLPHDPPNLLDSGDAPDLPRRPQAAQTPRPQTPKDDVDEQARMLKEFEDKKREQERLQRQREEEAARLAAMQSQQQRDFEEQKRLQAERERKAQEDLLNNQYSNQAAGRAAELEREILAMRGQYERDQMMLEQYDRRVKALEMELATIGQNVQAQLMGKDDMLRSLQDQVTLWKNKYEALAKLYSQLRTEHLDMLSRYKQMQLKANSAQEAIDKMERMERDHKSKNLELADMIKERDRARFDSDRMKSGHKDELERLRRDLRFAEERADDATRNKSSETKSLLAKYNRQMTELEDSLQAKQDEIERLLKQVNNHETDIARVRAEKDQEIEIMQHGMDETIRQLSDVQITQGATDEALNAQIDIMALDHKKSLNAIIDSVLQACIDKVDDARYEIESPMHAGNSNATPAVTLSILEKAIISTQEFGEVFKNHIDQVPGGEHVEVIKTSNVFAQDIADLLLNTKGITRLTARDEDADKLVAEGAKPGAIAVDFFKALQSFRLVGTTDKRGLVDRLENSTENALNGLNAAIDRLIPKADQNLAGISVDSALQGAANAIMAASRKLQELMSRSRDGTQFSASEIKVHDDILAAALAITAAIAELIRRATASQKEIVAQGRGSSSAQAFYKANSRWTEGLISAARAVADSTTLLIRTSDGLIQGTASLEEVIVASNEVAAATAQLVAASRVKADLRSPTQLALEQAARAVTDACKALVRQVRAITAAQGQARGLGNLTSMEDHSFKTLYFNTQVDIAKLEREIAEKRRQLGEIRREDYRRAPPEI